MTLLKTVLVLLLAGGAAQIDIFKKEMAPLQASVDAAVSNTGTRVMSNSKATYLDEYGVVVVVEVMLEPPRNPFDGFKTSDATKAIINTRYKELTTKISDLVKDRVVKTDSVASTESLTVIVHILNSNPADVPNLPGQLVISMKKTGTGPSIREL
jgi:hypothetical protein